MYQTLIYAPAEVLLTVQLRMIQSLSDQEFDNWLTQLGTCEIL